jgi:hypothetical protein
MDTDATGSSSGDSSTGGSSPPSTTMPGDDTSGDASSDGGTTDAETTGTTGDSPAGGRASLILRDDLETPGLDELYRIDWIDGALTEPIKISGPAAEGIVQTQLSYSQSMLLYRIFDSAQMGSAWHSIPLDGGAAGPVSPVNQPPAPTFGAISEPDFFADESAILYFAASDTSGDDAAIYLAQVTDGVAEAPTIVVPEPTEGESLLSDSSVSDSEAWLSYRRFAGESGPANAWIVPIAPLDPTGAVQVSDLDQPGQSASTVQFVPGDQAVWYRADRDIDQVDEIFLVDISGASPSTPVKVNDPILPGQDLQPTRLAPDGTRLAYFVGEGLRGDVWMVTFDGATASLPVDVSTLGDMEAYPADIAWSPDGAWLTYSAEHEQADALDLYLVDMNGADPSAPMLVTQPGVVPGGGITAFRFDPTGAWLYVIAEIESEAPELYRSDLSSGTPGELQKVSGALVDGGFLPGTIVFSHDATRVLYHATQDDPEVLELYMVDVSGATPGPSQKVNGPLAAGEELGFTAVWSGDDSAIAYRTVIGFGPEATSPLYITDRDALGTATLVSDDPEGFNVLGAVP